MLHPLGGLLRRALERRGGHAHVLHERRLDDLRAPAGKPRLGRPGPVQRGQRPREGRQPRASTSVPGAETTNITWNSNPRKPKNRELLDPQVKKALSMCVDRERIIEVVFNGYATTVESLVGHIAGDDGEPEPRPARVRLRRRATRCSTSSATRRARTASASPRRRRASTRRKRTRWTYEIITPTSTDFNVDRAFEIVQEGFAEAGVKRDAEGRRRHDGDLRARDRRGLRRREVDRLRERSTSPCGTGSATSTRTSCSRS